MANSIKNCRMNWGTEEHSYVLKTDGDLMCSIDFLLDMSRSLRLLAQYLGSTYKYEDELPKEIKVIGGSGSIFIDKRTEDS